MGCTCWSSAAKPLLLKGEYYTAHLIGCDLVNEGIVLGNVVSTVDGTSTTAGGCLQMTRSRGTVS